VRQTGNRARDCSICVRNALKHAYVHLSVQKFSRVILPESHFKREERDAKGIEGGIRRNGRKGMRKKDMKGKG
jgi:hypothetical protein